MNLISRFLVYIFLSTASITAVASTPQFSDSVINETVNRFMPGTSGFGTVKVNNISIDKNKKNIIIDFSEAASYIPLTSKSYRELTEACRQAFPSQYRNYSVELRSGENNLQELVLFAPKKNIGPTETDHFIVKHEAVKAPQGLDGTNIALWQSHGWYFEPKLNRWEWQRARIFQTVEDLYTQSYVMPFLMPMLENAGAYVMSPRERDVNVNEIIIDNDGGSLAGGNYKEFGNWKTADKKGFMHKESVLTEGYNPFAQGSSRTATSSKSNSAEWCAKIPEDGSYAVYISYPSLPNSTKAALYTVQAADGDHHFTVNQRMGGGTWIYLGHFPFKKGDDAKVRLSGKEGDKGSISADAVKIGGGYGNVGRKIKGSGFDYVTSSYPRFTEGARYFLQWAGAPDSVYTPNDNANDYTDDYCSRALWVNWLTGGSSMLPHREGLNIPVDLCFAFHSDAGTTMNDSIIGTLGIYCTSGDTLGNGSDRLASRDLTDLIMTEIVKDIRMTSEPNWTRRGMWDKRYYEARVPEVPSMLLELLSHQNMADMTYGLDPAFRFLVSRAVYKGMLKFIAHRDGRKYVIQPLPAKNFAITKKNKGKYTLSWAETVDSAESSASPDYYIIEERIGNGAFRKLAKTKKAEYTAVINDDLIHSFRIIAANEGGISFPSEVLALCEQPGSSETVTIVNGFTRIGAPDTFDAGSIAGFYDARDRGVPYVQDISYIGSMFEFRRDIPWMDDDAPGFGASRGNFETTVIAGNTFDFVYTHGEAIRNAGASFISSSIAAFTDSNDQPAIVDLILGKQKETSQGRGCYGTHFKAFPEALQNRMRKLAEYGTDFFVSGSYVASDLFDNPYADEAVQERDKAFGKDVLGFIWRVGQASIESGVYEIENRFKEFGKECFSFNITPNKECYAIESPDSFYPADAEKGAPVMLYRENNLIAATAMCDGERKTVVLGFPFETIEGSDNRNMLMKQILSFFNDEEACLSAPSINETQK